jgi:hypothetical protein
MKSNWVILTISRDGHIKTSDPIVFYYDAVCEYHQRVEKSTGGDEIQLMKIFMSTST